MTIPLPHATSRGPSRYLLTDLNTRLCLHGFELESFDCQMLLWSLPRAEGPDLMVVLEQADPDPATWRLERWQVRMLFNGYDPLFTLPLEDPDLLDHIDAALATPFSPIGRCVVTLTSAEAVAFGAAVQSLLGTAADPASEPPAAATLRTLVGELRHASVPDDRPALSGTSNGTPRDTGT
ncbi:hypothetical protein GCM10009678_05070 [Actinomadura kijaniata]|uniref:Uncharacterized protein n=1 Tax=Actinomadura namibiensis TaxID=182080 RepID=A0A7W3LTC0_ACTNM|nr:hypothetical protein [Actinomadura namibiensis]MBA8953929.1 hypothetical protein [Actinomadura namibiensis]